MKTIIVFLILSVLASPSTSFAQVSIADGTVLPLQLNSRLNTRKSKPGEEISARIMQDVPLSQGQKIRKGAKVVGHVVTVKEPKAGEPAEMTLRFDRLEFAHRSIPMSTSLRVLASAAEVEEAQVPAAATDRGTPWAWVTRNLIGGEVAYGEGGPVARGTEIIGKSLADGVLIPAEANPANRCRGEVAANAGPQAFWVFSSDACGAYGIADLEIIHAGRSNPLGEIILASRNGELNIRSGSGMLLRVNGVSR